MNLYSLLRGRAEQAGPVRVAVIGAGKFASMFFTQALHVPELHIVGVAELDVSKACAALNRTGWPEERYGATSCAEAHATGGTCVTDDSLSLISDPGVEVVVEITGNPVVGVEHAVTAIEHGKHLVMVNVEADCLVGPLLRQRAHEAGVVYSMAYGDQPALIAEQVDWARTVGYAVTAAGKGTKYLPEYRYSTPETVWQHYGLTEEQIAHGHFNPQMFNSFLDGTKSAIEMAAVANATGLVPQADGLRFPPASVDELPAVLRPASVGGQLADEPSDGTVEVASSMRRDGSAIERHLRWGVYVIFRARTDYAAACFAEYGVVTDATGRYGSLYRPYHMIGMELGVSVASAALRHEPTGEPRDFVGDVVTTAKRDLEAGERLDGEGGYRVRGTLAPTTHSLRQRAFPLGLAHGATLLRPVAKDQLVTWDDVHVDTSLLAVRLRQELEYRHG